MIDAYTHLDITSADPIADMKARMTQAGITGALAVETWKGDNLPWLLKMVADPSPRFRVAPCFRPDQQRPAHHLLQSGVVMGLRVRTADLRALQGLETELAASGKWLIPTPKTALAP